MFCDIGWLDVIFGIMHIPIPKWFTVKPSIGEAIAANTCPGFTGNHSGFGIIQSVMSIRPCCRYTNEKEE
jgi:hypothetical protein